MKKLLARIVLVLSWAVMLALCIICAAATVTEIRLYAEGPGTLAGATATLAVTAMFWLGLVTWVWIVVALWRLEYSIKKRAAEEKKIPIGRGETLVWQDGLQHINGKLIFRPVWEALCALPGVEDAVRASYESGKVVEVNISPTRALCVCVNHLDNGTKKFVIWNKFPAPAIQEFQKEPAAVTAFSSCVEQPQSSAAEPQRATETPPAALTNLGLTG